ncbi:MAG: transporter substrate-binding domain-containing protein, partial [Desulfobacteraceae bacterium]|nr:transporter substrate-binding domain-containing protein [Desulfobacteraceae bacterium]
MNTLPKSLTIAFLVLSIFISGLSADMVKAQSSAQEPMVTLTPEEKAWLIENPRIKLATLTNQPPFSMLDSKGKHTGILADVLELLSGAIGQKVEPELVNHATSATHEVAKEEGIYGSASILKTSRHANEYLLTDPFMTTPFYIYATTNNRSEIRRPANLNGKRVAVPRNHRAVAAYLAGIGGVQTIPVDTPLEQMQKVVSGEADVLIGYFTYPYLVNKYLMVDLVIAFIARSDQGIHMGVNPEHPVLLGILNKAIATLDDHAINASKGKWTQVSREAAFRLELTSGEQAWLKAHPDVTFGFTDSFEPFLIRGVRGQHTGILVDLLKELNSQLGTQFALEVDSWTVILEKVRKKEMGAVLGVAHETADAFGLLKTVPYYTVYPAFFARKDALLAIKSLDDLRGKSVAILNKAELMESILEPYGSDIDISRYPDNRTPLQMVSEGKVDLAFGLSIHAYYINKYGLFGVKPVHTLLEKPSKVGMAVRTDWPELVSILNKWLTSFSEQELDAIIRRWIDIPAQEKTIELTDEEKDWMAQNHTVRVRIADWPPYLIVKDDQPPQGIVIEYLKLIGERTGITFKHEITDQSFAEFLDRMKQRQGPDMTAVIVPTPEREQYLSFTEPYISSPYVIFIREEDNPILDIQALFGKTLAVPRGFVMQAQLESNYPGIKLTLYDSDDSALQALATGQADAYIGNLIVASHMIHGRGFTHLKVAAASPFGDQALSMGIRKTWPELTSIINKALASITEEEKTAIRNKYLAIKFEQGISKAEVLKWVLIVGGSTLSIVLLFLFWNRQMSREISKRKKTELALKQAKDYAVTAQVAAETANQAKSLFLANMSHELRTPLNAILGFSRMLAQKSNASADEKEKLSIINRSGQHLLSMIDDVLDLSKIEAESVELQEHPFDLVALIKEISVMIQSRAMGKGLSVAVEVESISVPYVKADVGKLRQILINLLGNAVKFTDEGGVTIRCGSDPIPEAPNRCQIVIEVEDTGPGIEPARMEKIFESFVQGIDEPVRKGTGLGLSICKKYAEFMGGTIEVESEAGKGSLFRVKLPAQIAEAADVKTSVDDKPRVIGLAPTQKTWRILVADDNRENLLLLKSLLESVGFFVLEAENGKEALAAFKKESPDFIWMDMRMPVMDGYEATMRIRKWEAAIRGQKTGVRSQKSEDLSSPDSFAAASKEQKTDVETQTSKLKPQFSNIQEPESSIRHPASSDQRPVPIIAITASAFREQRQEILAAGCDDMVTKPFQAHEIFAAMGRLLDIEYIYEPQSEAAPARVRKVELTAAMLADLPEELLQELRQKALTLNREAALEVIERIADSAPEVATGLKELVDNFQMAELQEL